MPKLTEEQELRLADVIECQEMSWEPIDEDLVNAGFLSRHDGSFVDTVRPTGKTI